MGDLAISSRAKGNILIEIQHHIKYGTGSQGAGVIAGAAGNSPEMLLEGIFMDKESLCCMDNGAVMLKEAFQGFHGLCQLLGRIALEYFMDIFPFGCQGNAIGKNFHIDFVVALDEDIALAVAGVESLLGSLQGFLETGIILSRGIDADVDIPFCIMAALDEPLSQIF